MKVYTKSWLRFFALFYLTLTGLTGKTQSSDSLSQIRQDSILSAAQVQVDRLRFQADSFRLADTLELNALQRQIANLGGGNEPQADALRAELDALQQIQETRFEDIRRRIDTLRANTPGYPVLLSRDTLFYIYSNLGPLAPGDRAANISRELEILGKDPLLDTASIIVFEGEQSHYLMYGELILMNITDRDAFWMNGSRREIAEQYASILRQSMTSEKEQARILDILARVGLLLLVLTAFYFGTRYMNKGLTWLNARLLRKGRKKFIRDVKIRNYKLLTARQEENLIKKLLNILKWLIIALVIYLALPVVFSIFPVTKPIATALFDLILSPLKSFTAAFVAYLPSLFTIVVVVLLTHYFLLFIKSLAREVERGRLQLPGFYPEWAQPTFNLLKVVVYAFAFIIVFPYLPGSDSPAFQGVSVFLGLLISLGSSSAISNIIAGLVIIYMRAFKIGDRVRIGETTGDVIEKTMLVTRVRTIKNEDVTIPNSSILSGTTINFSSSAKELGLILNSTVTIGYDVPWRQVHELLINAALKTENIKDNPQPFVLQTSLDDYYVSYQINAYTEESGAAAKIYSGLHANIQDAFNEAGVEILSPHYRATRDGSMITIPPDYKPAAFNVKPEKKEKEGKNEKPDQ